jgi:hypothetical protein
MDKPAWSWSAEKLVDSYEQTQIGDDVSSVASSGKCQFHKPSDPQSYTASKPHQETNDAARISEATYHLFLFAVKVLELEIGPVYSMWGLLLDILGNTDTAMDSQPTTTERPSAIIFSRIVYFEAERSSSS